MQDIVPGVYGDIDMVVCNVDFKCFGFDGQVVSPFNDSGRFLIESLSEKPFKFKEIRPSPALVQPGGKPFRFYKVSGLQIKQNNSLRRMCDPGADVKLFEVF